MGTQEKEGPVHAAAFPPSRYLSSFLSPNGVSLKSHVAILRNNFPVFHTGVNILAFFPKIPSGKVCGFGHVLEKFGGRNRSFVLSFGIFVLEFGIFTLRPCGCGKSFGIFARIFTPGSTERPISSL